MTVLPRLITATLTPGVDLGQTEAEKVELSAEPRIGRTR